MITELASKEKVIGVKQSRKAIRDGRAKQVFLACDADPAITEPIAEMCEDKGIELTWVPSMADLGRACGIDVGAAAAATVA